MDLRGAEGSMERVGVQKKKGDDIIYCNLRKLREIKLVTAKDWK